MAEARGSIDLLIRFVTPDWFRGPPSRDRIASSLPLLLAAEWTPDHVRGDEVDLERGALE